ncbi:MAG TPA: hypothetical protein DEB06_03365 [Phycisphaerales bacterium]|nr:hypothetical protein [Phycisphaerales bacterium]
MWGLGAGVIASTAIVSALAPSTHAAPEPEPIPRRWQLTLEPGDLRVTTIETAGVPRAYFFLTYKVTNSTGEDRFFAPWFELATDQGTVIRSGRGVPPEVTERIRESFRNPLLLDEVSVQGLLLQGDENAREGIVVWPADDLAADEVSVFAIGFSGETKAAVRPDNGETVILRKTLMLTHDTPGDIDPSSGRPLTRTQTRWILR